MTRTGYPNLGPNCSSAKTSKGFKEHRYTQKFQKTKKTTEQGSDAGKPPTAPASPATKINYNLLFFSAEDLARRNPKAGYLILGDDIPWEDFYAHMKIKACDQLFPNQPVVHNNSFDMNFAIARHVPSPLSLASAADYAHLLTNASKIKKNPTVKILLTSRTPNLEPGKENIAAAAAPAQDDGHPALKGPAEKKKKSRAPQETDILPANFAINSKIRTLREQQDTHSLGTKGRIFLSGTAILRSGQQQFMEKPLNILLFDPVSSHTAVSKSPLLQAHLNAISKEKALPLPPAAPVVNVVLPNDMFNPYQHLRLLAPALQITGLIPFTHSTGPRMSMEQFCSIFALSDDIFRRLDNNKYSGTQAFAHMEASKLRELGFKPGEIVDLKEAVLEWALCKK
ncbi:hypothetical protein K443DRAFT_9520 [Laccaria amethystina LaAM-08-1]|uniref:Uncharacterized protein n=1 Tax=Laccaria amethystina LaAM-08-1 TaxID=1095629 RepID=A0A0C9WM93_9AGAR|nr:hypothetical protein K443DRAFT_9520 [Laccaria amethystina LaAM-08-1]